MMKKYSIVLCLVVLYTHALTEQALINELSAELMQEYPEVLETLNEEMLAELEQEEPLYRKKSTETICKLLAQKIVTRELDLCNGSDRVIIKASPSSTSYTLLLPTNPGQAGQVLTTAGTSPDQLTWTTVTSGSGTIECPLVVPCCIDLLDSNNNLAGEICGTPLALIVAPQDARSLQTTADGDARGANAVDLQMARSLSSQVASGARSFIASGSGNTAGSTSAAVVAGIINSVTESGSGHADNSFIGAGYSNAIVADDAVAANSAIVAGHLNKVTASDNAFNAASAIVSGSGNAVSANDLGDAHNSFIGAGYYNNIVATGNNSSVEGSFIGAGKGSALDSDIGIIPVGNLIIAENGGDSNSSFIGAGNTNNISANGTHSSASNGAIVAGGRNQITAVDGGDSDSSFIGAGASNIISASTNSSSYYSAIAAGNNNNITAVDGGDSEASFIGAGVSNIISASGDNSFSYYSAIVAGGRNQITGVDGGGSVGSVIGAGVSNIISASGDNSSAASSAIVAGDRNMIGANIAALNPCPVRFDPPAGTYDSVIAAGRCNAIATFDTNSTAAYSGIVAGESNNITAADGGLSADSFIGAGFSNIISASGINSSVAKSAIAAGSLNNITADNSGDSLSSFIGAGFSNIISASGVDSRAYYSAIVAGLNNIITATGGNNSNSSFIGAGFYNLISNSYYSGILSGSGNSIEDSFSSVAGGQNAHALHTNVYVWGDGSVLVSSTQSNTFNVLASGGSVFYSDNTLTNGVVLAPGSGSWSSLSDKRTKENYEAVDTVEVLEKVARMPLETWSYKSQDSSIRHMGPYAQDFYAAFQLGEDPLRINTLDIDGVNFAAVQGMYKVHVQDMQAVVDYVKRLEDRIKVLEAQVLRS